MRCNVKGKKQDSYLPGQSTLMEEKDDSHTNHCKIVSVAKEKFETRKTC